MAKVSKYIRDKEYEFSWLSRALIIGLMLWAGSTLMRVDTGVNFNSHRIEHLESYHE